MKTKNLTQVSNITTGKLDANAEIPDGKFPFFTCAPTPLRINTFSFDDDVVLLAGNNAQGNFHLQRYKGKFDAYQRTYVITAKKGYDIDYIKYSLELSLKHLKRLAQGSQTKFLTMQILDSFQVLDFPYEEQKTLISSVCAIDSKIRLNVRICSELESMAKTLYDYWFVQLDFPDENGKPYRTSGGEMVWNEQLKREIPKGWKVKSLGKIIIENEKSKVQVNNAKNCKGNYPFFTSGDTNLRWNKAQVTGRNCFLNTGGNADVKYYVGEAAYSTDTWCITSQNGFEDYLYLLLLSYKPIMNRKFFQGTGLKHLQKPLLKAEKICIPNDIVLKKFNKKIQNIFPVISNIKRENEELIKLRDWLLPMLMNGQARVE